MTTPPPRASSLSPATEEQDGSFLWGLSCAVQDVPTIPVSPLHPLGTALILCWSPPWVCSSRSGERGWESPLKPVWGVLLRFKP